MKRLVAIGIKRKGEKKFKIIKGDDNAKRKRNKERICDFGFVGNDSNIKTD